MAQITQSLNEEWAAVAGSPDARRALMRWSATHAVFNQSEDLHDVLVLGYDPEVGPELRRALAMRASTDPLAARTLLQALLGGLCNLARRIGRDPDAIDDIVSIAWERIRTYPTHRHGSVSGNVLLDVRKRYERQFNDERHRADSVLLCEGPEDPGTPSPEDQVVASQLFEEVAVAASRAGVAKEVLQTIIRSRVLGESMDSLAVEHQVSRKVLWHRRWRGEARIRTQLLAA